MTVTSKLQPLTQEENVAGVEIGPSPAKPMQKTAQFVNSLHEVLWDVPPVGAIGQYYKGHDHERQSGGFPFHRSMVDAEFGGDTALFQVNPTVAGQKNPIHGAAFSLSTGRALNYLSRYYCTYGIPSGNTLDGWILVKPVRSKWRLEFEEHGVKWGQTLSRPLYAIDLDAIDETDTPVWVQIPGVPLSPGTVNNLMIYARNESYDAASTPYLEVYAWILAETPEKTTRLQGLKYGGIPSGGSDVYSWYAALPDEWFEADESLNTEKLFRLFATLNAHEQGTMNHPANGTSVATVQGHDHTKSPTTAYQGGRAVSRGMAGASGNGANLLFKCDLSSASTWTKADSGNLPTRSGSGAMFRPYVSPGMNSGVGSPPASGQTLTAYVYVTWSEAVTGFQLKIRVYNRDTGQTSDEVLLTVAGGGYNVNGQWVEINNVPVQGDQRNNLDIELFSDLSGVSSLEIYTNKVQWAEETYSSQGCVGSTSGVASVGGA